MSQSTQCENFAIFSEWTREKTKCYSIMYSFYNYHIMLNYGSLVCF